MRGKRAGRAQAPVKGRIAVAADRTRTVLAANGRRVARRHVSARGTRTALGHCRPVHAPLKTDGMSYQSAKNSSFKLSNIPHCAKNRCRSPRTESLPLFLRCGESPRRCRARPVHPGKLPPSSTAGRTTDGRMPCLSLFSSRATSRQPALLPAASSAYGAKIRALLPCSRYAAAQPLLIDTVMRLWVSLVGTPRTQWGLLSFSAAPLFFAP